MIRSVHCFLAWILFTACAFVVGCSTAGEGDCWGIGRACNQIDSASYVGLRSELVDSLQGATNVHDFFYVKAAWTKSEDCRELIRTWNRILSLYSIDRLHFCLEAIDPQSGSTSMIALADIDGQGLLISVRPPYVSGEVPPISTLLIDSLVAKRLLSRLTTGIDFDSIKPDPSAAEEDPAVQFCFLSTATHNYRWLIVGTQYHGDELSRKLLMRFDELMQRPY